MAKQVYGLDFPTRQPAAVDELPAGPAPSGGGLLSTPYDAGTPPPGRQVAGLLQAKPRTALQDTTGGAVAGLGAGESAGPSFDKRSAAINIGLGTASGAAAGAEVGGVYGAVAGGILGFATSSLEAWQQVSSENDRRRKSEELLREVEAKRKKSEDMARQDALGQLSYDRKEAAFQKSWGIAQAQRDSIMNLVNNNSTLRDRFIKTGVQSAYA